MNKTLWKHNFWLLLLLFLPLQIWGADPEVLARLKALPGVSNVKELESTTYANKYLLNVEQEVDPIHHQAGKFKQRVIVCHVGYDRPTVLVTEGYSCNYALRPNYQEELSKLLNANLVFVEYRYFEESTPNPCNWDYLTVENSLYDLHHVNRLFHQLYNHKWIATGISKGGQTCTFYRVWFPNDVDLSVPYVAPFNREAEDPRPEAFIENTVSTPENRQKVHDIQLELFKRKASLLPLFKQGANKGHYTYQLPIEDVYDFSVLEYSFAFWQWGYPINKVPAITAPDSTLYKHFMEINDFSYFSEQTSVLTFNVQAARELGYYSYDGKPFRKYLSIKSTKNYVHSLMLPDSLKNVKFSKALYKRTMRFFAQNDPTMIFIYGGIDPWGANGIHHQGLKLSEKKNIHVFVLPEGSHRTRINSFPTSQREEILRLIHNALGE
jgi:hypothetical protein